MDLRISVSPRHFSDAPGAADSGAPSETSQMGHDKMSWRREGGVFSSSTSLSGGNTRRPPHFVTA